MAKTVWKRKEGGPCMQRPAGTAAHTDKEREEGFEESAQEEASENTKTDSKEDPFDEHPLMNTQPN